jgi:hypothetical protein
MFLLAPVDANSLAYLAIRTRQAPFEWSLVADNEQESFFEVNV